MTESAPDARPGKRERNKAEKHRRIVEAATELFKERGFADTTTAAIAEAAGVGAGTLYLYVQSKEDLLVLVFQADAGAAWKKAFAGVDPTLPLDDRIIGIFNQVSRHHRRDPGLSRACFKELPFSSDAVSHRVMAFTRSFIGTLAEILAEAQDDGTLTPDVSSLVVANNLFSSWFHAMQLCFAGWIDEATMDRRLDRSVRTALWGLTIDRDD